MSFKFAEPDNLENNIPSSNHYWKILIVDDELEVHTVTAMVLKKFQFMQQGIHLHHAYSATEANEILDSLGDVALVYLDVVMEEENSGFKVVNYIRETLNNHFIQIILRTGQAGSISEEDSMLSYEINGFKQKAELSATHLISTTIASLRAYDLLHKIQKGSGAKHA